MSNKKISDEAACINGETAIFVIYHEKHSARHCCMHQCVIYHKKHSARHCCMHQWRDSDFRHISSKAFCSPLLHASMARQRFSLYIIKSILLAVAACINGETAIFVIYHKKHSACHCCMHQKCINGETAIFVIYYKKHSARHCYMQQWRDSDFRYIS